jgi:hypothetical protein
MLFSYHAFSRKSLNYVRYCSNTSDECCGWTLIFSFEEVKNYLRNSQSQDKLSSLGLMNIEKYFLNKLQPKPSFLDEVIDLFAKKNRRIELNYKQ